MRHILLTIILCAAALLAQAEQATHEFMLSNGLKVLVREDHRAPVATFQLWYKIGSSYEHNGNTGLSHFLEHMMFQGTKTHPQGQFADIITAHGGELNAFTSYDFTGYYESLPADQIEIAFQLEADRMRNIDFTRESFERERQVVIEERRLRTDDVPQQLAYERIQGMVFLTNPYRHPVVGWAADIKHAPFESAFEWYNRWYHPNNATLIVVGDVEPKAILTLAKKYFEPIPQSSITPVFTTPEPASLGEKRMDINVNVALPELLISVNVPSYAQPDTQEDAVVLALISQILDGGLSARFEAKLVREQNLANQIGTSYMPFMRLSTTFEINAVPHQDVTLDVLEQAIWQEMIALTITPVTDAELTRAKMQFKASDIFGRDDISDQASYIGTLESIGLSYKDKDVFLKAIEDVDAQQILIVAKRYFTRDNLTVARLIPASSMEKKHDASF